MAQRALPPGAVRRRTAFGLFDANGWTWASIKAIFWFLLIIFLLAYLPDRAYYFTVLPTIDVGYNVISPINWCDARNRGLDCPAPEGAFVPWDPNPPLLALPGPRSRAMAFSVGERVYVAGGVTAEEATDSVLENSVTAAGNFPAGWVETAPLLEPRADAATAVVSGVPYLLGGVDAAGNVTTSVLRAVIDEGAVSGWEDVEELTLPVAITDAAAVGTPRGIYLFGGRVDGGISSAVYLSAFDQAATPRLQPWVEVTELPLPEPRASATAVLEQTFIYVLGGEGPQGASEMVFFLALDAEGHPVIDTSTQRAQGWGVSAGPAAHFALPEPRMRHASFRNGGAIYVIGGEGPDGALARESYWAVPDTEDGSIPAWHRTDVMDLPEGRADAGVVALAGHAFLAGGETDAGPSDEVLRSNLAPALPFFRLGLFGMTLPGLAIPGEIGQELGLIMATGAGTTMFVVLVIIGLAYSHPRTTMRVIERLSRGRFRAPPEEPQPERRV